MASYARLRRLFWTWILPLLGISALGLALWAYLAQPRVRGFHLRMTAGSEAGARHELAEMLRDEVASSGVVLDLRGCRGSEEALDWVNERTVDCALIQGGLSVGERPNVRQVAMLHVEPLHLLVRKDLYEEVSKGLKALDGKTVNTGEIGSGTHILASAVLEFAGVPRQKDKGFGYVCNTMSREELFAAKDASALPDAVFLVTSLPGPTIKYLVTRHGYRLVALPFGEAFALESLTKEERRQRGPGATTIDKARTYTATIPAFTYGLEPPMPAEPLPTLGNRLLLVAHKDVDRRAVTQLIGAVYGSEFAKTVRPPLEPRLMDLPPELPLHEGAELYRARNQPLVSGDVLNYAQKGVAIFAAGLSGLVVLWQWLKNRRQAAKAGEFRQLLNQVTKLDEEAMRLEEMNADVDALLALRARLAQLRSETLDRFSEGELDDNQLMTSFLAHVGAARDNVTRLIHERRGQSPNVGNGSPQAGASSQAKTLAG